MKKNFVRTLAAAMVITVSAACAVTAYADEAVKIKLGYTHSNPDREVDDEVMYAETFKELVEANSDTITVELYPGNALGSQADTVGAVASGTVEMTIQNESQLNNYDPNTMVYGMPGAFTNAEECNKVLDSDWSKQLFEDSCAVTGIRVLGNYCSGMRCFTSKGHEMRSVEDAKGLTFRIPESAVYTAIVNAISANPVPMPSSEMYVAMQNGVVDGQENPVQNLINSFVKIIDPETKEYKSSNENIFELLFYKINKKNNKFQKKILEKYLTSLQEITNIEESFNTSSLSNNELKKCLNLYEYYEFISKLIGDFKFQNSEEVYLVFEKLFIEYENNICVCKAKYKQYKEDDNTKKMDLKLICSYLKSGLYLFLLRFLLIKYQIFSEDQIKDLNNEGWKKFLEKNISIENKKMKLPKKLEPKIGKFKFIEFYSNFEILNIQLFDNQVKPNNKFTKDNKMNINNCLGRLKSFANMDISTFIGLYNGKKRAFSDLSFKILFDDNINKKG